MFSHTRGRRGVNLSAMKCLVLIIFLFCLADSTAAIADEKFVTELYDTGQTKVEKTYKNGKLKPIPVEVRPLSEINEAIEALQAGQVTGRIVFNPQAGL